MDIKDCKGYKTLRTSVDADLTGSSKGWHDYEGKFKWVLARAQHYADKTGIAAADILDSWEKDRNYWYMNYYQDCNQPEIKSDRVRVFDTVKDASIAIGRGFRCPACGGVSTDAYECDTGLKMPGTDKACDWKVYGLFRDLGKGITVFCKDQIKANLIFMPVAWETQDEQQTGNTDGKSETEAGTTSTPAGTPAA